MTARDLFTLARDLRAAGIPYETDDGSEYPLPMPVRHQTALYIAIGHLVERGERLPWNVGLYRRTMVALRWIQDLGKRSRWAGWFR